VALGGVCGQRVGYVVWVGAFPLIAILVLHSGPAEVPVLAAAGLAVGAAVAVPLGPWAEFRRKRPVMVAMDLTRFVALMSVPAAFALGWLSFPQLLVVSVIVAAANIAFTAASGACLKALVRPEDLLVANGRFESTTWTATVLGPPLGGAAIGLFGPVIAVVADAVSYLLSALGIRAIGGSEPQPARTDAPRLRAGDLLEGGGTS
jgi:MFS family permease